MVKQFYDWNQVNNLCISIARDITVSKFHPELIVGLTRGGLVPATMLSHYFKVPLATLAVNLRDGAGQPESSFEIAHASFSGKQILIVDDINDSGATLNWIKKDFESRWAMPDVWSKVWGVSTRTAVLTHNQGSSAEVDYTGTTIDKRDRDTWIVYPWEQLWGDTNC